MTLSLCTLLCDRCYLLCSLADGSGLVFLEVCKPCGILDLLRPPESGKITHKHYCLEKSSWSITVIMRIDLTFVLISALSSSVNSNVFTLVSEKMNWTDARSYCRQHHTDLVTLNDRTDMDELLQSLPSGLVSLMWIGLYRTDEYFPWVWVWSDGSKDLFTSWDPSQPNNVDGVQYCVCTSPKGYWSDWWCTDKLPFLCYTKKKRQIVRLEVKSSQNVNDPAVKSKILAKFEQTLRENGLTDAKPSWKESSGEHVFHKMWYQKSDAFNVSCRRTTN